LATLEFDTAVISLGGRNCVEDLKEDLLAEKEGSDELA
jgi:hypothetical protein